MQSLNDDVALSQLLTELTQFFGAEKGIVKTYAFDFFWCTLNEFMSLFTFFKRLESITGSLQRI